MAEWRSQTSVADERDPTVVPRLSMAAALAQFTEHHTIVEHRLSRRTLYDYGRDFTRFGAFLDGKKPLTRVNDVQGSDVSDYLERLSNRHVSASTRARYLSSIRMVFAFLANKGLVAHDPTLGIERPSFKSKPPTILSDEGVAKLLRAPDRRSPWGTRNAAMLALLYATGLRASEALALKVSSVDFGAWLVRAGRGRKARTLFLNDATYLALRSYVDRARPEILRRGHADALFVTSLGVAMTTRTLARILTAAGRKAGVRKPLVVHSLRHSFAAHLVERGVDIRVVRAMLGLASIAGAKMYKRDSYLPSASSTNPLPLNDLEQEIAKR